VRVRAFNTLWGPYTETTASTGAADLYITRPAFDALTGAPEDRGAPLGMTLQLKAWATTGLTILGTLPAHHRVLAVHVAVVEEVSGTSPILDVGTAADPDAYAGAIGVGVAGTSATRDRNHLPGADLGAYIDTARELHAALSTLTPTTGKVLVTVAYECVPAMPA
jgi:hypothetical protein